MVEERVGSGDILNAECHGSVPVVYRNTYEATHRQRRAAPLRRDAVHVLSAVSFPPRVASIATGWSDPIAGWELHPLKIEHIYIAHTESDLLHESDPLHRSDPLGKPLSRSHPLDAVPALRSRP